MGRRTSRRYVKSTPNNFYFASRDALSEDSQTITVAEFEAMRLKHYINLNQKDAADKMGVSQPTFSRILENAHQKVTQAIIEGKTIRVSGGNVTFKRMFKGYGCLNCNNEWEDENASQDRIVPCPECGSKKVYFLIKEPL